METISLKGGNPASRHTDRCKAADEADVELLLCPIDSGNQKHDLLKRGLAGSQPYQGHPLE